MHRSGVGLNAVIFIMLTHLFLLQGLLHHCFVVLMVQMKEVLERIKLYSVEF